MFFFSSFVSPLLLPVSNSFLPERKCNKNGFNYIDLTESIVLKGIAQTWQDCWNKCKERIHLKNCEYFTFQSTEHPKWCRLLSDYKRSVVDERMVSGPRTCGLLSGKLLFYVYEGSLKGQLRVQDFFKPPI